MKKIVIPTILTATILLAGMFAFMPVQKASTIHSSLFGSQVIRGHSDNLSLAASDTIVATSNADFTVCYVINNATGGGLSVVLLDGTFSDTLTVATVSFHDACVGGNAGDSITLGPAGGALEAYATLQTTAGATASVTVS